MTARRDPGLQSERTLLAWRRTALGLMANAALLLAAGLHDSTGDTGPGSPTVRLATGVVVAVIALTCWGAVGAVYRGRIAPQTLGSQAVIRLATALLLAVGAFDAYAVLTH